MVTTRTLNLFCETQETIGKCQVRVQVCRKQTIEGYEWKQEEQVSSHSGQGERYHGHELEWEQKSKYEVFLFERYLRSDIYNKYLYGAGRAKAIREREIRNCFVCLFSICKLSDRQCYLLREDYWSRQIWSGEVSSLMWNLLI